MDFTGFLEDVLVNWNFLINRCFSWGNPRICTGFSIALLDWIAKGQLTLSQINTVMALYQL